MKQPERPNLARRPAKRRRPVVDPKDVQVTRISEIPEEPESAPPVDAGNETASLSKRQQRKRARAQRKAQQQQQRSGRNAPGEGVNGGTAGIDQDRSEAGASVVDATLLDRLTAQDLQRRHQRRMRLASFAGALIGGVLVVYIIFFSPLFRYHLEQCQVVNAKNVPASTVCDATAVFANRSIIALATAGVREKILAKVPELKDVEVSPVWLHGLKMSVVERVPVATVRQDGKIVGVDRYAIPLEVAPGLVDNLPQLDVDLESLGGKTQKLVLAALQVFGDMPEELRVQVRSVTSDDPAQLEFKMRDGRDLVWGDVDDGVEKAQVAKLLFTIQGVRIVDVSVPDHPSTR